VYRSEHVYLEQIREQLSYNGDFGIITEHITFITLFIGELLQDHLSESFLTEI
jgi:hypothetical protein